MQRNTQILSAKIETTSLHTLHTGDCVHVACTQTRTKSELGSPLTLCSYCLTDTAPPPNNDKANLDFNSRV